MKPLPDFDNAEAMADRGRRSLLGSLRREATEALRDAHTALDHCDWGDLTDGAKRAREACERLITLACIWNELSEDSGTLVPLLKASIDQARRAKADA